MTEEHQRSDHADVTLPLSTAEVSSCKALSLFSVKDPSCQSQVVPEVLEKSRVDSQAEFSSVNCESYSTP